MMFKQKTVFQLMLKNTGTAKILFLIFFPLKIGISY